MSFCGTEFIFDGISCREFGLELYSEMASAKQDETAFASSLKFAEDRVARRHQSICYGGTYEDVLEFTLVFGPTERRRATGVDFDRWDMQRISSWLTDQKQYKWLQITQDDLGDVRYHCRIEKLQVIEISGYSWGFQCKVVCDSPFGFMTPRTDAYAVRGSLDVLCHNPGSYNGFYYPKLTIDLSAGTSVSIINHSDGDHVFSLSDLPSGVGTITFDGQNQILTCTGGLNLYPSWNFKLFRLIRGDNQLTITGTGNISISSEFPVNIGG